LEIFNEVRWPSMGFFSCGGRGLNPRPCILYAWSIPTELSSRWRERLWYIRKSLCTVHKSQHNCFLHPQMKPTQNKTKRTKRGIFNLIINTVVHYHHRTGMPKPFCCGNGFQNLQSHHQHRRSSSSPYRNAKTILLWKTIRCT